MFQASPQPRGSQNRVSNTALIQYFHIPQFCCPEFCTAADAKENVTASTVKNKYPKTTERPARKRERTPATCFRLFDMKSVKIHVIVIYRLKAMSLPTHTTPCLLVCMIWTQSYAVGILPAQGEGE